jgi:hypothetical protein
LFPYGVGCRLFTGSGTIDTSRTSSTKRHTSSFGILVDRSKEIYSHFRKGKRVSLKKTKLPCAEKAFKIADETLLLLFDTLSSLCPLFHALKRSIPNNSHWNNCYYQRRPTHN